MIRECKSQMLSYLIRDIRSFIGLIVLHGTDMLDGLKQNEKNNMHAIITMYYQQNNMFNSGVHTCVNRIISIFQPHIRPIVRGKSKSPTEFGAKIGASVVNGYTFIDHHSWDAYNESMDLPLHIDLYQKRFGFLPKEFMQTRFI